MRLLCLTNLFPDTSQPWQGLDNVTLLHAMRDVEPQLDTRVLCMRPGHSYWTGADCRFQPRKGDEVLNPTYHWAPYIPKLGGMNDKLYALGVKKALKSLPKGWQPDVLLVPWLFPDACGVNHVSELAHLPLLAVAQGSDVHEYMEMPLRKKALMALCERAFIVTRSEDLRLRLIKAGAEASTITTIYNGVDIDRFRPGDRKAAQRELGLPEGRKTLLYVGNFHEIKGVELLIQAVSLVHKKQPVHLVLIGSGHLENDIRKWCQEGGLGPTEINFAGRHGPEKVALYMQAADAVCLSSLGEGVPNVLFEAFASGRAFVTTDVGGISEVTDQSPSGGFLVNSRDPADYARVLQSALDNPPDENALSGFTAQYSWPRSAQSYLTRLFALSANRQ